MRQVQNIYKTGVATGALHSDRVLPPIDAWPP